MEEKKYWDNYWVDNKEKHADDTADIITFYFMAQRLKPVSTDDKAAHKLYTEQLTLLHQMLVVCMKTKQTTDLSHIDQLRVLLSQFKNVY